jgi:hypothetical protein
MWLAPSNGFHEEPDPEFFRRMGPPENEIPAVLPLTAILARTPDAAVALTRIAVFSTGLLVDLVVRVRPGAVPAVDIHQMLWSDGDGSPRMLIGLELADGTRVDNLRRQAPLDDVVFSPQGGSGNEHSVDQGWWLYPLPASGPMRFVVRCPELGIAETSTELDAAAVQRAVQDVVELWPWTPPEPAEDERGLPPDVPEDSWFAGP